MKNAEFNMINKIYDECRVEEVVNETYALWYDYVVGIPPLCYCEYGEWIWSKDITKLTRGINEYLFRNLACSLCDNLECEIEGKSTKEILLIYANEFSTSIMNLQTAKELLDLLEDEVNDFSSLDIYLNKAIFLYNKLGVECSYKLCKGDACMEEVIEHYGGVFPAYESIKEYLIEDVIE